MDTNCSLSLLMLNCMDATPPSRLNSYVLMRDLQMVKPKTNSRVS